VAGTASINGIDLLAPVAQSAWTNQLKGIQMNKIIAYTMSALLVTAAISTAGPDKETIMAKEKAAWQAFKDKKADDFKKVVDKDIRVVGAAGVNDLNKEIADMQKWDLKSFAFSDFDAFSDEKDVMVTTYTVKLEGTFDGKDATGTYHAGSVWKMENGDWLGIFHSNVKAEAAAK
jgi:uncharacterized protein DUF4440